jgi:hypothetical protein
MGVVLSLGVSLALLVGVRQSLRVDGMASIVPLAVVLVVAFGKPHLNGTPQRWEAPALRRGRSAPPPDMARAAT